MKTGIHIGAVIDKSSLEPLTDSILRILEAKADQKTIRHALSVLSEKAEVKSASISNVNIYGNGKIEETQDD